MPKSTTSFLFPDINVWIALTIDRHVHHSRATGWFESIGGSGRLFFCRFTQMGLLRLLTLEAVMGQKEVMAQADAWKAYDRWLEDERVGFLDEPTEIETAFRSLTQSGQAAPKDWADSYLAAFATAAHLTLVTFDRAFSNKARQLVLLEPLK
jgi:toxin-antitoxin system PIN domain toxin